MAKVFLIDDDVDVIAQYKAALSGLGHELTTAGSAAEARAALSKGTPEVAVVDILMDNGIPGFDLAREIHEKAPRAPILMVSSLNSELKSPFDSSPDAKLPIFKFLDKPVSGKTLVAEIKKALASAGNPAKK
jgi:two-component system OmpR family response regulator